MKKTSIALIGFCILISLAGIAGADRGVDPTPETAGIHTSTTIDAVGRFSSHTDFSGRVLSSDNNGLGDVPPLGAGDTMYTAVYTEDTQSNGEGIILYDKELSIDTGGMVSGQSNIEATKQLFYVGLEGGRVYSDEYIMIDGVGTATDATGLTLCPFAAGGTAPGYCSMVEAGSTIDMSRVNVRTSSDSRFIMTSADYPVALNHEIVVNELAQGVPSQGLVSAYINALIMEGSGSNALAGRIEASELTTVYGNITIFHKVMSYESGMRR